jgi:hypothetical protein
MSPALVAASVGENPRSSRTGTRWSCALNATAVLRQNASVTQRKVGVRFERHARSFGVRAAESLSGCAVGVQAEIFGPTSQQERMRRDGADRQDDG